ncbi:MAG: YqaA family protein [Rhodocyclaceae bacterium]|jgi:membrane protein YqaA with SNARE-associated domain|nr:YqaA family protein [Rhodocyclaceae bacterium]
MDLIATPEAGLLGLFLASFLAATLLPGGSEVALVAFIVAHPEQTPAALLLATLGNTLGGLTTYGMGRLIPLKVGAGPPQADFRPPVGGSETGLREWGANKVGVTEANPRGIGGIAPGAAQFTRSHAAMLYRWGPAALLLSWAPLVGDALCAAAGWLRLPLLPCVLWMAAGKAARYGVLVMLTLYFNGS